MRPRISVRGLVHPLVGWLVHWLVMLSSNLGLLRVLDDGAGRKRDEEKRATRRKEGRGGMSNEEEGGTRRKEGRGGRSKVEVATRR